MSNTVSTPKKRIVAIDMVKGLLFLWVPAVHLLYWDEIPDTVYVLVNGFFSAIMVSYFFLSGYTYRPGKRSIGADILQRARQILLPFVLWTVGICLIEGAMAVLTGSAPPAEALSSIAKANMYVHGLGESGPPDPLMITLGMHLIAFWFPVQMFLSSLLFFPLSRVIPKNPKAGAGIAFLLLAASALLRFFIGKDILLGLSETPAYAAVLMLGCLAGQRHLLDKCPLKPKPFLLSCLPAWGISVLLTIWNGGSSDWGTENLWSVFVKLIQLALQLWILVFGCERLSNVKPIRRFLTWFGQHTLTILFAHMVFAYFISLLTGWYTYSAHPMDEVSQVLLQTILMYVVTITACCIFCLLKDRLYAAVKSKKQK